MDNKARIREIVERLRKRIKDPRLELDYNTPLDLLVASILAAQSQDRKVNEVTKGLFAELKDVDDYIELGEEGIAERISSINFYKRKARLIHQCMLQIKKREGGKVPSSLERLTALPGVGRKTAQMVLGGAYGKPALIVDTHFARVSKRLGLTKSSRPDAVEEDIRAILPQDLWTLYSFLVILHGRYTCRARGPKCGECVIYDLCPWEGKV
jgi:endonuclease-3